MSQADCWLWSREPEGRLPAVSGSCGVLILFRIWVCPLRGEASTATVWGKGMGRVALGAGAPEEAKLCIGDPSPQHARVLASPFLLWGAGSQGVRGCWSWLGVASALFEL